MLPFSHVWIVLVVRLFGKIYNCLKKQTGLMEETCLPVHIMSFPAQLCLSYQTKCYGTSLLSIRAFETDITVYLLVCTLFVAFCSTGGGVDTANLWLRVLHKWTLTHSRQIVIFKRTFHLHLMSSLSHTLLLTPRYRDTHILAPTHSDDIAPSHAISQRLDEMAAEIRAKYRDNTSALFLLSVFISSPCVPSPVFSGHSTSE